MVLSKSPKPQPKHADEERTNARRLRNPPSAAEEVRNSTLSLIKEMMDPYWSWRFMRMNKA